MNIIRKPTTSPLERLSHSVRKALSDGRRYTQRVALSVMTAAGVSNISCGPGVFVPGLDGVAYELSCPLDPPLNDPDCDQILSEFDNCPYVSNISQADSDGNGVGNACEGDPGFLDPTVITVPDNPPLSPPTEPPFNPPDSPVEDDFYQEVEPNDTDEQANALTLVNDRVKVKGHLDNFMENHNPEDIFSFQSNAGDEYRINVFSSDIDFNIQAYTDGWHFCNDNGDETCSKTVYCPGPCSRTFTTPLSGTHFISIFGGVGNDSHTGNYEFTLERTLSNPQDDPIENPPEEPPIEPPQESGIMQGTYSGQYFCDVSLDAPLINYQEASSDTINNSFSFDENGSLLNATDEPVYVGQTFDCPRDCTGLVSIAEGVVVGGVNFFRFQYTTIRSGPATPIVNGQEYPTENLTRTSIVDFLLGQSENSTSLLFVQADRYDENVQSPPLGSWTETYDCEGTFDN